MNLAKIFSSPFTAHTAVDEDLAFAIQCVFVFGPYIAKYREQQQQLQKLADALEPLRQALRPLRSTPARKVAPERDVAMLALLTAALRWPDRTQAVGYVKGFRVVGNLDAPAVFK